MSEFNLSDKIDWFDKNIKEAGGTLGIGFVKEFIKNQFEIIEELLSVQDAIELEREFDKLAGPKLTETIGKEKVQ